MSGFDFENSNPVGYVDILPNGNANIEVLGYVNYHNDYYKLTSKERIDMFPPKGRIFAHNFIQRHDNLNKRLICLTVMPNEKPGDNLDAYIWDKSGSVYEYGEIISTIKETINEDGENNFIIFQENNLIETEENQYILSGDKVFYVKANSKDRLIPYWNVSNINIIETPYGKKFLVGFQLPEIDGVIDITNDDQLISWFMTKILKKHWIEIMDADSYKSVELHLVAAFNDMKNLTPNVCKSRLERLKKLNVNFFMTLDELQDISEIPWVKNVIEQTIEAHKQSLISDLSVDYKQKLDKMKDEYETMLKMEQESYEDSVKLQKEHYESILKSITKEEAEITEVLDEKKLEIEIIDETIASKNAEIAKIDKLVNKANERKNNLISDFSIIKDVLEMGSHTETIQLQNLETDCRNCLNIHAINEVDSECVMFEAFGKSLEETLKFNKLSYQNASTIAETLAVYNILIVPDLAYAMSIIHASQKCYYGMEYVNVGWKSFSNLWNEGLSSMVEHCRQESDIMHYLILQNINLTYLPNYMQPLLDIQMGMTNSLPSGEKHPENLRILCTLTNEEVIPLSEQCIKRIGCIEKPSKKEFVPRFEAQYDSRYGYLTPKKLAERASANPSNFYKTYINE